jgi:hypothetical protein
MSVLFQTSPVAENKVHNLSTETKDFVSPSQARVKMDSSITAGVVERSLSQLRLLQSPIKPMKKTTGGEEAKNGASESIREALLDDHGANSPPISPGALKTSLVKRKSSKLKTTWPPLMDSEKRQKMINERKQHTSKEIQQVITRQSSGSIQERKSVYESASKGCEEAFVSDSMAWSTTSSTLSPTRSEPRESASCNGETMLPAQCESLDERHEGQGQELAHRRGANDHDEKPSAGLDQMTKVAVGHTFADIVLPCGQRLPPPQGRKKHRRTNYRIRYQGPTLLRLEDVYGNLMDIPEVDDRFSTAIRDEAPLIKPVRRGGGRDNWTSNLDSPPTCPPRPHYDDYDKDREDDDTSISQTEMFAGSRPDIWITPLNAMNGSRTWKVKRIWDNEDIDDEEPEYQVDHSDLMSSIRELLGVPEDLGSTTDDWEVNIDETSPWDNTGDKDSPLAPPCKPVFRVKTVYDVEGQLDGSEPSISLTETDFESKIHDITEYTDHNMVVPEETPVDAIIPINSTRIGSPRSICRPGDTGPHKAKTKTKLGKWKDTSGSPTMASPKSITTTNADDTEGKKTKRGRPTWEKQPSGLSKQKQPMKMWWH